MDNYKLFSPKTCTIWWFALHSEMVTVVKLIIYPSSHIVTSLGDFLRLIVGFIYSKLVCFFTRLWTVEGRCYILSLLVDLILKSTLYTTFRHNNTVLLAIITMLSTPSPGFIYLITTRGVGVCVCVYVVRASESSCVSPTMQHFSSCICRAVFLKILVLDPPASGIANW